MKNIVYMGHEIQVINDTTIGFDDVQSIEEKFLFISEPDGDGDRYAYNISELEGDVNQFERLFSHNGSLFTENDLAELMKRSSVIDKFIFAKYQSTQNWVDKISEKTLQQMRSLPERTGIMPKDEKFVNSVRAKYSETELKQLMTDFKQTSIENTVRDLARNEALMQFCEYYKGLPKEEADAIDNFPGIKKILLRNNLGNSLANIFNVEADTCLGGTVGVCQAILKAVQFSKTINNIYVKKSNTTTPVLNVTASNAEASSSLKEKTPTITKKQSQEEGRDKIQETSRKISISKLFKEPNKSILKLFKGKSSKQLDDNSEHSSKIEKKSHPKV